MEPKHSLNPFFFLFFPTEILFNFTILLMGPRTLLISQLRNFEDIFHFSFFVCLFFSSPFHWFVTKSHHSFYEMTLGYTPLLSILIFAFFSHQVVSNSLWPCGLQHARPPCSSPSPGVCPSSCPLNQWFHPTISSSVTLVSFCLQSFPLSESFPMSQLFTSGGQSIGVSASASVLPLSIWGLFPLGLTLPTLKPKLTLLQLSIYLLKIYLFGCVGFFIVAHGSSCSTACEILVFWWGMEAMSSVLQGGFLTTGPLGKFIPLFKRFFCGAPWLLLLLSLCPFQLFLLNAIPRTTLKSFCLLVPTL